MPIWKNTISILSLIMIFFFSILAVPHTVIAHGGSKSHHDSSSDGFSSPINPQILNPDADLIGRALPVPVNPLTPPNQAPVTALSRALITAGLELPKNLIVPSCPASTVSAGTGCPPVVGTMGPDLIIATAVQDATIYGVGGNDIIQCGPGNCKVYAGPGDNVIMAGTLLLLSFLGVQAITCS